MKQSYKENKVVKQTLYIDNVWFLDEIGGVKTKGF